MGKDTTAFRERFNAYKNGKSVSEIYDAGLPRYAGGTPSYNNTMQFLKQYEGFKDTAYLDGNGVPTIGYGFTDTALVSKGKISRAEADARLRQEVANREKFLSKMKNWDKLSEDSKTALRSYYYNYPAGFKPSTKFMQAWNAGNYSEAIRQVDAGMNDKKNPGLRTRRLKEQAMLKADPFLMPLTNVPVQEHVEVPVSTAVRQTIPQEYNIYGYDPIFQDHRKPVMPDLKLQPRYNLPSLLQMLSDSEWNPEFPGFKNGKSIHINPANRGKFNATKKRTGKTTEELAHSKNPLTRKRAIFALNSRKWSH